MHHSPRHPSCTLLDASSSSNEPLKFPCSACLAILVGSPKKGTARMNPNHSHARSSSPPRDVRGRYILDAKNTSKVTLTGNGTARDPYASYRHSPDSVSDSEETTAPDADSPVPIRIVSPGDEAVLTEPRVRFRSRVRISAGIGRRRGRASNPSSISGSPSSSISAPLRTHYTGSNGWGTLGSRLKLATTPTTPYSDDDVNGGTGNVNWKGDERARRRWVRSSWTYLDDDADELTHLLTATSRHSYGRYGHNYHDYSERQRRWQEQLVDEAFGKWPGRLLNRHWWWWRLEQIICCFCEPDDEDLI